MQSDLVFMPSNPTFAELYQQYAPEIFTYLRLHTPTKEDAEDLLVDVFLAALGQTNFQAIPPEKQRAWLWRVARNKTIDLYRGTKRRTFTQLEQLTDTLYFNEAMEPEQHTLSAERYALMLKQIQQLPAAQRQVIYLRFVHGLSSKSMAQVMNRREGTVRMLLSRALNALRVKYYTEE